MKTSNLLSAAFALMAIVLLSACGDKKTTNQQGKESDGDAVTADLSDVIEIQKKYKKTMDIPNEEYARFIGFDIDKYSKFYIYDSTEDFVKMPENDGKQNKFLKVGQDFYNSAILVFDIWNNFELYARNVENGEDSPHKNIIDGITAMKTDEIGDAELKQTIDTYKKEIIELISKEKDINSLMEKAFASSGKFGKVLSEKNNEFSKAKDAYVYGNDSLSTAFRDMTKEQFKKYVEAPEETRLEVMMKAFSECKTYDEQCSLLINWSDCKESEFENEWIAAVALRLLKSGKYSPFNGFIWATWRCLAQESCFGLSRDSYIPNNLYNDMRRMCFNTIVKHIAENPDDMYATAWAINTASSFNINRYGNYPYGNDCTVLMMMQMPKRFE